MPVHELVVDPNGVPYFTMKLVQGEPFHHWLADPERPPGSSERLEEGLEIFLKVCDAIAYAHHRGVVHRDLKPDNIMVAGFGQVYVMDWGLAKLTRTRPASGSGAQMEAPGPVGTPAYMAPEQARGNPGEMDERSDVFGLGAMLYEIVSGKVPYGSERDPDRIIERAKAGRGRGHRRRDQGHRRLEAHPRHHRQGDAAGSGRRAIQTVTRAAAARCTISCAAACTCRARRSRRAASSCARATPATPPT